MAAEQLPILNAMVVASYLASLAEPASYLASLAELASYWQQMSNHQRTKMWIKTWQQMKTWQQKHVLQAVVELVELVEAEVVVEAELHLVALPLEQTTFETAQPSFLELPEAGFLWV